MKKNRSFTVFSFYLYLLGIVLLAASLFAGGISVLRLTASVIYLIGTVCYLFATRCPHCGRCGLLVRPHSESPGYCRRCGRHVEFDYSISRKERSV